MIAVVLADGFRFSLPPITDRIPKPCVPIAQVPCVVHVVNALLLAGIEDIRISLHCMAEQVRRAVLDHVGGSNAKIQFFEEPVPLGDAGCLLHCLSGSDEDFIVVNGDTYFSFDLRPAMEYHIRFSSDVTVVTTSDERGNSVFGSVIVGPDHRVRGFVTDSFLSQPYFDSINAGIYLCSRRVLDFIEDLSDDFVKNVFPRVLDEHLSVVQYATAGFFSDLNTVSSYLSANNSAILKSGDSVFFELCDGNEILSPCSIGANVRLKNCRIGPYAVIGDGCDLEGVSVSDSVLFDGVRAGSGAEIHNAVLCSEVLLEPGVRVCDDCVVGAECEIGFDSVLTSSVRVFSSNKIPSNVCLTRSVYRKYFSFMPEDGKIVFPLGEDFSGAMLYEVGRALGESFGGDVAVGRSEPRDVAATMTLCGGVMATGQSACDTGVNDPARFRYTVRRHSFRCGVFLQRNYSSLTMLLFDEHGMPLSPSLEYRFSKVLSASAGFGDFSGSYRVFRGGEKLYRDYLRSFGVPARLPLRVISSPFMASILPSADGVFLERMRIGSEWVRIERSDGEPFPDDSVRLCACIALGKRSDSSVCIPDDFPGVAESVAETFGFRVLRMSVDDPNFRKVYPLTDPNVISLLILKLLESENRTFSEFVSQFPSVCSKQRDVSVLVPQRVILRSLMGPDSAFREEVRINDRGGIVRIRPKGNFNAFHVVSEASNAELAEELCDFYCKKLKGLRPR